MPTLICSLNAPSLSCILLEPLNILGDGCDAITGPSRPRPDNYVYCLSQVSVISLVLFESRECRYAGVRTHDHSFFSQTPTCLLFQAYSEVVS